MNAGVLHIYVAYSMNADKIAKAGSLISALPRGFLHPCRGIGLIFLSHSFGFCPAVDPGYSVRPDVSVRELVSRVRQGVLQRYERVAAAPEHPKQLRHQVAIKLTCVNQ